MADEQRKDPEIGPANEWVSTGQRPPWEEVRPRGPALCALWRQYESLVLKDNVLCCIFHKPDGTADFCQTIMPTSLSRDSASFLVAYCHCHNILCIRTHSCEDVPILVTWGKWATEIDNQSLVWRPHSYRLQESLTWHRTTVKGSTLPVSLYTSPSPRD